MLASKFALRFLLGNLVNRVAYPWTNNQWWRNEDWEKGWKQTEQEFMTMMNNGLTFTPA